MILQNWLKTYQFPNVCETEAQWQSLFAAFKLAIKLFRQSNNV